MDAACIERGINLEPELESRLGEIFGEKDETGDGTGTSGVEEAAQRLEEGGERFDTLSGIRAARNSDYDDLAGEISPTIAGDFSVAEANQTPEGLLEHLSDLFGDQKVVLLYDPSGSTGSIFDAYREDVRPVSSKTHAEPARVAGYILAEAIKDAAEFSASKHGLPRENAEALVNGRRISPDATEKLVEKELYRKSDSFCIHAAIHHFEMSRSDTIKSKLSSRANSPGSDNADERLLKEMFDEFDRYSGDMPFKDFMGAYRQQSVDDDSPLNWTVRDVMKETGSYPDSFIEGMYENTR